MLWDQTQPDPPGGELADGQVFTVGDVELTVLHTPGTRRVRAASTRRRWASCSPGDTLFNGGPGATGRSFSDFPTIIESIRTRLLDLPPDTVVLTGHGDPTTIGAEAPHLQDWIARGH